jgi:predicted nucleic acid-binding protein
VSEQLLDTSALLAHALGETGAAAVGELLAAGSVLVAAPTAVDFAIRLAAGGASAGRIAEVWANYRSMIDAVLPVDERVAARAVELRRAARSRVPLVDLLIAAAADLRGATLVHRDPHMLALPPGQAGQRNLLAP